MEDNKYISRRNFLRKCGAAAIGLSIVGVGSYLAKRSLTLENMTWQIDPAKCTNCGRCETECVLKISAVKCIHASPVCGYCDLCGGYFRQSIKTLTTAAENLICPTGAIQRRFVEEPYFEYTIDETLCNGCGKCAKGCNSFGNGSLYMQINQELCKHCNECQIELRCPSNAITRIPANQGYILKG